MHTEFEEKQFYADTLLLPFRSYASYNVVTEKTVKVYARGMTCLVNFVVNLVSSPHVSELPVSVSPQLQGAVNKFLEIQNTERLFFVLDAVFIQKASRVDPVLFTCSKRSA